MSLFNYIHGYRYRKDCPDCKGTGCIFQGLGSPPEQCECGGLTEEEEDVIEEQYKRKEKLRAAFGDIVSGCSLFEMEVRDES